MTATSRQAWICDSIRTPIGRYGGILSSVRPDDLCVHVINAIMQRSPNVNWNDVDDLIMGCANQSGEDNRNVARMAGLLSDLPQSVSAITVNRLCASGMDAVATAARAICAGEANLCIAGGVESMSRAPFVLSKSSRPFDRGQTFHDTTLGWRFTHPKMESLFGTESMPQTAENVAAQFGVSRVDQDAFALRSQVRAKRAKDAGFFQNEIEPISVPSHQNDLTTVLDDEHPRPNTSAEALANLKPFVHSDGTITAGNASGINDGACALLVASDKAIDKYRLKPLARVVRTVVVGVEPRIMGIGPAPATKKLLDVAGISMADIGVIELNEAFGSQCVAVLRELGLPDDAEQVNPNGGAIALGHPLGMSGARLVATAARQLSHVEKPYAVCTMCVGVGQGIAMLLERA